MSISYSYANLTKKEWFSADAIGGCSSWRCLGLNLGSRAFNLLLIGEHSHARTPGPPSGGSWAGDSIAIIGDNADEWRLYDAEFVDLQADVILLVYRHDGFEQIGEAAGRDNLLFMQICHLIVMRQALELEPHMSQLFGPKFRQRYKKLCEECAWFKPKDLVRTAGS